MLLVWLYHGRPEISLDVIIFLNSQLFGSFRKQADFNFIRLHFLKRPAQHLSRLLQPSMGNQSVLRTYANQQERVLSDPGP